MCGIVGITGRDDRAVGVLVDGLRRLEYRGYDSAGVAVIHEGDIEVRRTEGRMAALESLLQQKPLAGSVGIGHTRWATHGKPSTRNAHPHRAGRVVIVQNGIVENYGALRAQLESAGRRMESETDTELIAHLIDEGVGEGLDLLSATRAATARVEGSYALGVLCADDPDHVVAAKNGGSPIILGIGEKACYLASDIPAILPYTRQMVFLEDGEFAVLSPDGVQIVDAEGRPVDREPRAIQWDPIAAEKGGYDRFMQKEIFEQPRAVTDTIGTRVSEVEGSVDLNGIDLSPEAVARISRIYMVACGTAFYSCMVGKYMFEQIAGIPTEVDLASEFRYRKPILDGSTLVVPVSQSGETADTLAALREGKANGSRVLAVCNVRDATIARESDDVLYTQAGPEIGVASTKAFTTQLVAHYLLALKMGISSGRVDEAAARDHVHDLLKLPRTLEHVLSLDGSVREIARRYFKASNFLFLGRGIMYPIALEGALKLKEISYIHAEGYAAGEMKHGPIALIDENMPVVVIADQSPVYDKIVSNLEQVRAREGRVIAVCSEGDEEIREKVDEVIPIPELGEYLTSIVAVLPLQLLAYHVATLKGTDVDQPRNLAKSVTVE